MPKVLKNVEAVGDLEAEIVRLIHARGATSRVELARVLKLVPSTAGVYVDRLIANGYLTETAGETRGLGRPPKRLDLDPAGGRFVGVDFDARQILAAAVDFAQQPLRQVRRTIPARATADRVLSMIADAIADVIEPAGAPVRGVGLGVPGVVDPDRGVALSYRFIRGWENVPVGPRIAEQFGWPVFVENNVRSMALGELWGGQGRGKRDVVCLGIRSGIGAGVIVRGKLLRGANNAAGEIGRWLYPDWLTSGEAGPKAPRTIEDVASVTALLAEAHRLAGTSGEGPGISDVLAAAAAGDSRLAALLRDAARVHAWMLHQLVGLLDPEHVVYAGPLIESDAYRSDLHRALVELGGKDLAARVSPSTLGPFAGALGAAALAFHNWQPRR